MGLPDRVLGSLLLLGKAALHLLELAREGLFRSNLRGSGGRRGGLGRLRVGGRRALGRWGVGGRLGALLGLKTGPLYALLGLPVELLDLLDAALRLGGDPLLLGTNPRLVLAPLGRFEPRQRLALRGLAGQALLLVGRVRLGCRCGSCIGVRRRCRGCLGGRGRELLGRVRLRGGRLCAGVRCAPGGLRLAGRTLLLLRRALPLRPRPLLAPRLGALALLSLALAPRAPRIGLVLRLRLGPGSLRLLRMLAPLPRQMLLVGARLRLRLLLLALTLLASELGGTRGRRRGRGCARGRGARHARGLLGHTLGLFGRALLLLLRLASEQGHVG
jgi:hypothetical protein